MRIWRDVFSVKDWQKIMDETKKHDDPEATRILSDISQHLKSYHKIKKTKLSTMPARQEALKKLHELAEEYKSHLGSENFKKKPEGQPKNLKLKSSSIDPWVDSLSRRAEKKSQYLDELQKHYANTDAKYIKKNNLLGSLDEREKKRKARTEQTDRSQFLPLAGGTFMEKLDPLHRPFEFNIDDIKNNNLADKTPMSHAFIQWANENKKNKNNKQARSPPFFLWLENHPILTSSKISDSWSNAFKTKVTSVSYDPVSALHVTVAPDAKLGSVLVGRKKNEAVSTTLNTWDMSTELILKPGSPLGATAFIWDKDDKNLFITDVHEAGKHHHSSLKAGAKVRSAGMWLVEDGKISIINNNSGHYKPTSLAFYQLIKHLQELNVLSENVLINDLRRPSEFTNPEQPFLGTKNPNIPLDKYLEWAESLDEVKLYLTRNDPQIQLKSEQPAKQVKTEEVSLNSTDAPQQQNEETKLPAGQKKAGVSNLLANLSPQSLRRSAAEWSKKNNSMTRISSISSGLFSQTKKKPESTDMRKSEHDKQEFAKRGIHKK